MKKLLPVVFATMAVLGFNQSALAITVVSGGDDGFLSGIVPITIIPGVVDVSAASPLNNVTPQLKTLIANPDRIDMRLGGVAEYDTFVRGIKDFRVTVPTMSTANQAISASLEIVTAALGRFAGGATNPESILLLNGQFVGVLANSDFPASGPVTTERFSTATRQIFDISSIYSNLGSIATARVIPAGNAAQVPLDGYFVSSIAISAVDAADEPLPDSSAVPLPAAFWLLVTGILSLTGFRKRK